MKNKLHKNMEINSQTKPLTQLHSQLAVRREECEVRGTSSKNPPALRK
jgi:hypothetical protein